MPQTVLRIFYFSKFHDFLVFEKCHFLSKILNCPYSQQIHCPIQPNCHMQLCLEESAELKWRLKSFSSEMPQSSIVTSIIRSLRRFFSQYGYFNIFQLCTLTCALKGWACITLHSQWGHLTLSLGFFFCQTSFTYCFIIKLWDDIMYFKTVSFTTSDVYWIARLSSWIAYMVCFILTMRTLYLRLLLFADILL